MPAIFTIGETIYDIIFKNDKPVTARPGGSMLNAAVSLGRCGLRVEMITELGKDHVGEMIRTFLEENGVSTSYIKPSPSFKTPVSLAFLDEQGHARYSFYKHYPEDRLNINWPEAGRGDVVLFGSFYSLDPAIREKITFFIKKAKQNGALIFYDPNIRKNHLDEIRELMHLVHENISLADIVRGSDEDFENLFGLTEGEKTFEYIQKKGCHHLIITSGDKGAELYSDQIRMNMPAPKIDAISTIGAGDSFNAGIICGLLKMGFNVENLVDISPESWSRLIDFGINFASEVCRSYDNYISLHYAQKNFV